LTPELYHFQSYIEYEGNLAMQEDYNSTRNGHTGYETVADPEGQELNQFSRTYLYHPIEAHFLLHYLMQMLAEA
jgi:hypothetical protein